MIDVIMVYIVGVNNNNICDQFILISLGWRRRRTMPPKRINWTVVVSFIISRRWRDMAMNFKIGRSWAKFTWLVVEETVEWREGYNYWLIVVDFMQIKSSFFERFLKMFLFVIISRQIHGLQFLVGFIISIVIIVVDTYLEKERKGDHQLVNK